MAKAAQRAGMAAPVVAVSGAMAAAPAFVSAPVHTALAAARDIQTGYLWVNWSSEHIPGSSFGGVKNSGIGREEGLEEIESYTQSKNVYIRF